MEEKEMIRKLQKKVVIPEIVQKKADQAFDRIGKENAKVTHLSGYRRRGKTIGIIIAAAVFALGTMTVCAAYIRWSKGFEAEFEATESQKQMLVEKQFTAPVNEENSVTSNGVTVTAQQSIVDKHFAWLSFKVEGYDLEEGKEPCFDWTDIEVEGEEETPLSYNSSFYDGLHYEDGRGFCYEDGTSAEDADGNVIGKYMDDDGDMEYVVSIDCTNYCLIDKTIRVTFHNLGTVYKAGFTPDLEAEWELTMEMKGSEDVRSVELSAPLGESGAVVTYAEISPISLYVNYDFPLRKEEIEGFNEKGERITSTTFVEAPALTGVRLKDGTLLTGIGNGGREGYLDGNENIYTASYAIRSILEPEQVDALLFIKSLPEEKNGLTAENLYIVPLQ